MSVFRDDLLKGKTALITGGGTGICKGIAHAFSLHGANVAITSRKQENLDLARDEIQNITGNTVLAAAADVRQPEAVEAVVAQTVETFGCIDILINGAAGNFPAPVSQLSYNGFNTVLNIDLQGTFNMTKASFPHLMAAAESSGSANVICITATLQYTGMPFQAHVNAAKAGIDAFSRTIANEWGPIGIRCNCVAPGPIADTEGMRRLAPTDELMNQVSDHIPLRELGTIQDIANTCLFLSSDAAKYTTGTIAVVDGGQWISSPGVGDLSL
ncbi:MAG TPA: SDR family oxidoreductase [Candidatus Hydrogenedentes bacterium]|nr:SDR family oxidoreductase [Candidatus Hydrogenedentota bacterium]